MCIYLDICLFFGVAEGGLHQMQGGDDSVIMKFMRCMEACDFIYL